jgi:hypothetical protein
VNYLLHLAVVLAAVEWLTETVFGGAVLFVLQCVAFYYFYVFGMNVVHSHRAGNFEWEHYVLFGAPLVLFLIWDFLFNTVAGTLIFQEWPQWKGNYKDWEYLFTARITRWMVHIPQNRRARFARYVCRVLLNPLAIDGNHCHPDAIAEKLAEAAPAVS